MAPLSVAYALLSLTTSSANSLNYHSDKHNKLCLVQIDDLWIELSFESSLVLSIALRVEC